MIKYRISTTNPVITQEQVISETPTTVTYFDDFFKSERTERKVSSHGYWFDTWNDAHEWMKRRAIVHLRNANEMLEAAKAHIDNVNLMVPPPEDTTKL